jgi:hypothetical protein
MATPVGAKDFTDKRAPWDWKSRYPAEANAHINREAWILAIALIAFLLLASATLCFAGHPVRFPLLGSLLGDPAAPVMIEPQLIGVFFSGGVGGATFSIKWLIHSVAKGMWHLDRRYWRLLVPLIGGVYACVVLTLLDAGFIGAQTAQTTRSTASAAALGFLIGYFSDGVSGLLTNVANAVFGTLQEK